MSDTHDKGQITGQPVGPSMGHVTDQPPANGGGSITAAPTGGGFAIGTPSTTQMVLFVASFLTLVAAGIGFSIRAAILGDWSKQFGFTQGELGGITGGGLVGFGVTIIAFSFFADRVGYGLLMVIAFLLHTSSAVVTLAAGPMYTAYGKDGAYWCLYIGMFLFSLGNGTCEAVINPLTATLFPRNKTHWLNILHAGWPGGLILGALLGLGFAALNVRWEIQMAVFLVPTLAYGLLMVGRRFPHSEAKSHGVTLPRMMQELGLSGAAIAALLLGLWFSNLLAEAGQPPVFGWGVAVVLLLIFGYFSQFKLGHWMLAMLLVLHALVGYVELGTDSWITNITGTILSNKYLALTLFIWTSGLMFALRFFAGPIVHKISPLGLLFASAVLGMCGLLLLGWANGFLLLAVAATVYGLGKTFYWPTLLGVASERYPRGGALVLGMMGGVGMLSAGLLGGPGIGYKQDYFASRNLKENKEAPGAYDRYAARNDKGELDEKAPLPFLPKIAGLDGQKVATLLGKPGEKNGDAQLLAEDLRVLLTASNRMQEQLKAWDEKPADERKPLMELFEEPEFKAQLAEVLADPKNKSLKALYDWWEGYRRVTWTGGYQEVRGAKEYAKVDKGPVGEATLYGGKTALTYTAIVPAILALGFLILIGYFRLHGGYKAEVLIGHAAEDERFTGGTEGPGEG